MSKNLKKIIALFMSVLLITGFMEAFRLETVNAAVKANNFELDIYRADEYLKKGNVCNHIIKNLMKDDYLPSQVIVRELDSKKFKRNVTQWELLHFAEKSPYEIAQGEIDKKGYYEAVLLSVFISESKLDNSLLDMGKTVSAESNQILSSINSWVKQSDAIGLNKLGSNQKISSLTEGQKKDLKNYMGGLFEKQHPMLAKSGDIVGIFNDVFSSADTVYDAINKMAYYTNACEISNQSKNLIHLMYKNCPKSNLAMKEALRELELSLDGFISGVQAEIQSVVIKQSSDVLGALADAGWEKVINANPYVAAFCFGGKIGTKIGDSICNTFFSTDKTIEQYEKMKCLGEFYDLLNSSVQKLEQTYIKKKTLENAQNYIASVDVLFSTVRLSCKFGIEYADVLYKDAALGWIGISDKKYSKFVSDIKSIQKRYESEQKNLVKNYMSNLKEDYPAVYKKIILGQFDNDTNGNLTETMNQKAHKAYMKQVKEDKKNFVYGGGKLKYLFIDLDGDTIDELITYPECNMPDQIIYTYSKGTVRQIDMLNYCRIDVYYESTHVTQSTYDNWNIGMKQVSYSRWNNGSNVCIASESCQYMYEYNLVDKPIWHTFINEKEVAKTKYQKYIETLKKGKMIDFSKITWKKY